jgi:FkbM family methyltransferase
VLDKLLGALPDGIQFVNVGANVGEFVIHAGKHAHVKSVVAFEPVEACVAACEKSVGYNKLTNVRLERRVLSERSETVRFRVNEKCAAASSIVGFDDRGTETATSTIDDRLKPWDGPSLLLLDVEGAEVRVLQGAQKYILSTKPVIIFEYNHLSRTFFTLDDVRGALGPRYVVYRLRKDARLDCDFRETWNCIAVPDTCSGLVDNMVQ